MTPALAGAVTGVYKYRAESADLSQWEIGEGTYTSGTTTLTRTTVLYNSAGTGTATGQSGAGSKINFSAPPRVGIVQAVQDTLEIENTGSFTTGQKSQARTNIGMADGHIPGEPSNGSAAAGEVGEAPTVATGSSSPASGTPANLCSLTLQPGDYEIMAYVNWTGAGATTSSDWASIVSTSSTASVLAANSITGFQYHTRRPAAADVSEQHIHMPYKVSISVATTYYLHHAATYATSTYGATGYLRARRAR